MTTPMENHEIPKGEHEQRMTISIDVFVPDHPDRTESPIFRHTRDKLIKDNSMAVCEVNNADCDHDHPLELHHDMVEWCDSEGVDWDKIKKDCPEFPWETFDPAHPEQFIDSEFNAKRVLCKKHHTGKDHGIHFLPMPIWQMQKYKRDDFILTPDEEK